MQSLRFTNPLQDRMLDNVPNQRLEREREEGIALMEAALMASPQAAVNGPRRRKRTKYNSWQKNLLEKAYAVCKYPNVWTRETLSKALNVDDARIIVWFQNRRARYSRQSAGSHQRGRPTTSNAFETQLPTGTLHYPNTAAPAPNQGPCTGSTRRPLADVMHKPNALPVGHCPVVGSHCPPAPQSLKLECDAFAPSCAVGYGAGLEALPAHGHWCCVAGSPSVGAPARYPVDEIEVDFTVADFNMDLGNEYLLDLSQNL